MSMFEQASRLKIRFDTPVGQLSADELWDLPLSRKGSQKVSLDDIARALYQELRNSSDVVSFVNPSTSGNTTLQLKFDVVKHIIDVRLAENQAAVNQKAVAEQKQQLLSIINSKENKALEDLTVEELRAKVDSLTSANR